MELKEILMSLKKGEIDSINAELKIQDILKGLSIRNSSNKTIEFQSNGLVEELIDEPVVKFEEIDSTIVLLTIQDKINKNTFTKQIIYGLMESFEKIKNNHNYKAVIITGYDSYFCCGGSMEMLLELYEGNAKMTDVSLCKEVLECKIPIIGAMQGHCIGGGWCLGMFCDFPIMSLESTYTCNHVKYGFTPGDGATLIFTEKLGVPLGQEILFTGKNYKGSELKNKGVQIPILPRVEVLKYALSLAREFSEVPRETLILLKEHMNSSIISRLDNALKIEWEMQEKTFVNKHEVLEKILLKFNQSPEKLKMKKNTTDIIKTKVNNIDKKIEIEEYKNELIKLNGKLDERPVFWIHGEGGGVEAYQMIAKISERPFYGIEAKGRMSEDEALEGIDEIINHYIKIIKSIQPKGPYDLGGYSFGGVLAYELCRRLQNLGERVNTIVMIDSIDSKGIKKIRLSNKTIILQNINMSLINRGKRRSLKLSDKLINRDEVDLNLDDKEFLEELIKLGKKRGLSTSKSDEDLHKTFSKNIEIMNKYNSTEFTIIPLNHPDQVKCYYFRNGNQSFLGDLEIYLSTGLDDLQIDETSYWKDWSENIVDFNIIDVPSTNHMTMLFESGVYKKINTICKKIYSIQNKKLITKE